MRCKRTVRRPTRWTPDEWRQVDAAADARNVPPARFVREAENDPAKAVPRSRLDNLMRRTKREQGINIPRLGYHGEKRAGIRDPKFRSLDPAVQEELAGTTWDTMRRVYDFVDVGTLKAAVALLEVDTTPAPRPVGRGGLKKAT